MEQAADGRRPELLYVILDADGRCRRVVDGGTEPVDGLAALLADGWRPVRETAWQATGQILILLERDGPESGGFGFA